MPHLAKREGGRLLPPKRFAAHHFQALARMANGAVVTTTADGVVDFWSEQAEALLEFAEQEVLGNSIARVLGAEGAAWVCRSIRADRSGPALLRSICHRKNGALLDVELTLSAIEDDRGAAIGAVIVCRATTRPIGVEPTPASGSGPSGRARDCASTGASQAAGEAQLRIVLDALSDGVAAIDAKGETVFVNDAMARLLGYAGSAQLPVMGLTEILGRVEAFTMDGTPLEPAQRPIVRALAGETTIDLPLRMRQTVQGREYDVVNTAIPVRDGSGRVSMAVLRMRDVSELHSTVDALKVSQQRYQLAMQAVDAMVYDWDVETGHVMRSGGLERILGFRVDETEPTVDWWRSRIHPDDRSRAGSQIEAELATRRERHVAQYRIQHREGHWVWVADRGIAVYDEAGRPVRVVGSTVDVSHTLTARQALRESEERYRSLVEGANDIVATLDLEFRLTSVNAAIERVLGFVPAEVIGTSLNLYVPEDQVATHRDKLMRKLAGATDTRYEMQLLGKDRRRRFTLEVSSRLLVDASGRPTAIHAIARDITERKEAEARQALLVREVQHRTRNMLSVVQAIATQSFDGPLVPTKVRDAFIRRLQALAHAQTFVAAGPGGGVPTRELLTAALLSFGPRVRIACDATLIDGSTAQTLALVMHELASNSTQFGALSVEPGSVEVSCVFDSSLVPGQLRLAWTERGGPPVSPPERTGFGARLLRVAGTAQLDFDRAGFAYRLAVPIPPHSMVM